MNRRNPLILGLLSVSIISLELSWTRIFSAEFFYTFAFLILSLAILGLGLGALALRLFPGLGRDRIGPGIDRYPPRGVLVRIRSRPGGTGAVVPARSRDAAAKERLVERIFSCREAPCPPRCNLMFHRSGGMR